MQLHPVSCLLILAIGLLIHPATARAQAPAPTASVSGRVSQAATGQYLNNARVAVQGTNLVAFTDESGTYRLDRVAAGTVVLEVFYTGLEPQTVSLALAPAATIEKDIALVAPTRAGAIRNVDGNAEFGAFSKKPVFGTSSIYGAGGLPVQGPRPAKNGWQAVRAGERS